MISSLICEFVKHLPNLKHLQYPGLAIEYSRYLEEVSSVLDADEGYQKSVNRAGDGKEVGL